MEGWKVSISGMKEEGPSLVTPDAREGEADLPVLSLAPPTDHRTSCARERDPTGGGGSRAGGRGAGHSVDAENQVLPSKVGSDAPSQV